MSKTTDAPPHSVAVRADRPRKIALGEEFCPHAYTHGGDKHCDHDYPPETKRESDHGADWTCSKCGMRTVFDFWD